MSIADELRRDAEAALKEYGMFYSGEYLRGIAKRVEEVEAENAKLRELIIDMLVDEERGHNDDDTYYEHVRLANGLGIEVRSRWSALTGTRGARTTATR
jgi:hypothetical protein